MVMLLTLRADTLFHVSIVRKGDTEMTNELFTDGIVSESLANIAGRHRLNVR